MCERLCDCVKKCMKVVCMSRGNIYACMYLHVTDVCEKAYRCV